jgi:hypothetical protein
MFLLASVFVTTMMFVHCEVCGGDGVVYVLLMVMVAADGVVTVLVLLFSMRLNVLAGTRMWCLSRRNKIKISHHKP